MLILIEYRTSIMSYSLFGYKHSPSHVTIVRGAAAYTIVEAVLKVKYLILGRIKIIIHDIFI